MYNSYNKKILLIGPLPPPIGGVSIHIVRLSKLITDEFMIDYVDESSQIKPGFFNLRTFRLSSYLRKVRWSDLLYIHSGKRQLVIFHILVGRLFGKKVILTVHGYPNPKKNIFTLLDSWFYSLADRIVVVNSFILDRVKLPAEKSIVRNAFVPPLMADEPELPPHLLEWLRFRKEKGEIIISANAYQLKLFNSQDLYGLDMCIDAAERLVEEGYPVSFFFNVSSLDKNRELYEQYQERIQKGNFREHFLLLNEVISFVRLITYSDIILRPTNTDGDALTIREALHFGKPIIASDIIPRPEGTVLFKCRDNEDLVRAITETLSTYVPSNHFDLDENVREYEVFYKRLIDSVFFNADFKVFRPLVSLKDKTRLLAEKIPPSAGVFLNYIPFRIRLGREYKKFYRRADILMRSDSQTKKNFIVQNLNFTFRHFRINSPFYNHFLLQSKCNITEIKRIEDIAALPLITKTALREMPVESRTVLKYGMRQVNTGGTSGSPLSFFLEDNFYSREWSHMHYMWRKIGYDPTMTKITVRGKNIRDIFKYRFNQNEFLINSYYSFTKEDYSKLLNLFRRYNTKFIHGYPSAIYYFLKEISSSAPFLLEFLQKNIKGVMFGSEYPSPHFRNYIESILTENTISWYGHTEGVVLAGELYNKFEYVPFHSYGFTEAVLVDNQYHLVGTSYDNLAAPFIRYDTEDLITPEFDESGLLKSFRITEGRLGEFIRDRNNKMISLTALIFGRHHKLFERVNFIQVKQIVPGQIIIYYSNSNYIENAADLFDSTNLNIEVFFQQVNEPFKTSFGKIPLLIK
jgi:phenylacetate-CoA ligase